MSTGVFREIVTGGPAVLRLIRGHQHGQIHTWSTPVDAPRGVFADGGSTPPASTTNLFFEVLFGC